MLFPYRFIRKFAKKNILICNPEIIDTGLLWRYVGVAVGCFAIVPWNLGEKVE